MTDTPSEDVSRRPTDAVRAAAAAPLLFAIGFWAVGLPLLPRLGGGRVTGTATATLVGLALVALIAGVLAFIRLPRDPIALPLAGVAASAATLLALAPLDHPARVGDLLSFLLVAPWRYALPPLLVHFALEAGWPHQRERWTGLVLGWYGVQLGMFLVVGVGLVMGETPLVDAVDLTLRAAIVEPAAVLTAAACAIAALFSSSGRLLRRPTAFVLAAVVVGMGPLLIGDFAPVLATPIDGAVTPARLALLALPTLAALAVLSLPFRDAQSRDIVAWRLAAIMLDRDRLHSGLEQLAALLHATFDTRGVRIRLTDPDLVVTAGDIGAGAAGVPVSPEIGDQHAQLAVILGRAADPLGEVRLEGRFPGAFGSVEREWLEALLSPVTAMLRGHRREARSEARSAALTARFAAATSDAIRAAALLPAPSASLQDPAPPTVDAREVLAQLGEGVTDVARHGGGLMSTAVEASARARGAADSVAQAFDTLVALHGDVAGLGRLGEQIAVSNTTISGVAFRTNLVANNASLEATRAGAAGRAFGVLAEEVRRLADTTAATSTAISQHTLALANQVSDVSGVLERTRHALALAIREAEASEAAAEQLSATAAALEDTARSLNPVLTEASAVAQRRSTRDQHLTETLERFITERSRLARALTDHRTALDHLARALNEVTTSSRARP